MPRTLATWPACQTLLVAVIIGISFPSLLRGKLSTSLRKKLLGTGSSTSYHAFVAHVRRVCLDEQELGPTANTIASAASARSASTPTACITASITTRATLVLRTALLLANRARTTTRIVRAASLIATEQELGKGSHCRCLVAPAFVTEGVSHPDNARSKTAVTDLQR